MTPLCQNPVGKDDGCFQWGEAEHLKVYDFDFVSKILIITIKLSIIVFIVFHY